MKYKGKKYIAIDNSYEQNLSDPKAEKEYLAGTVFSEPIVTTIISEPFEINYLGAYSTQKRPHLFVLLLTDNGDTFLTGFYRHGVVTKYNTIEQIIQRQKIDF